MPENTITSESNKELYIKDLKMGYHPRGLCEKEGGCLIYRLFGDLSIAGKFIVPSVYFYPANNGGNTFRNLQKAFGGSIGGGRLEIARNSPRGRSGLASQPYMTTETWVGVMIHAPFELVIHDDDERYKILVLKTLEFLADKIDNQEYSFMLGGKRGDKYGRAKAVFINESGNFLQRGRNNIGLKDDVAAEIDKKFQELVVEEKEKFPIKKVEENKEK
jgi:hypothetical protein